MQLLLYLMKHWRCDTEPFSVGLKVESLFLQAWSPQACGSDCIQQGSDCTQQLCKGFSAPFMLFTAKSMESQRDPESHWHRSIVFPTLTCAFNPPNASLLKLYGCNPDPTDLNGNLPTESTGLLIMAHTCGVNFTFKSCANQPGL